MSLRSRFVLAFVQNRHFGIIGIPPENKHGGRVSRLQTVRNECESCGTDVRETVQVKCPRVCERTPYAPEKTMIRTNDGRPCDFVLLLVAASVLLASIQAHKLEFAIEPSDTVVESGHFAVLDCVVKPTNYSSNVLIQWLDQDRQVLTFIGDSYRSQLINGSLYINSVIEGQGLTGTYQCKASLPNVGSIVSRTANLSLASLSGFYQEPRDLTVYRGQKAHFACRVQASPPPKIKWLKDERLLQLDELRMTVLPSGALEIDEVQASDQGSYRCNATGLNTYRLSNKAMLIVSEDEDQAMSISPPSFIAIPQSEVVKEGENLTLDCAANGRPKPKISWLKDGLDIDMADLDSRFSMIGSTSSLHITRVREEDSGTYQCRAANREDSFDTSATIKVQVPPKFLTKPEDKIDYVHRDIELECSVYGKPEPKVQWLKNGEYITPNDYYQFVNGNNLKIMGLMGTDSGIFQCLASNPAGNIQASATLKVLNSEPKPKTSKTRNRKKFSDPFGSKTLNRTQSLSLFTSLKPEKSARLGDVDFAHLDPGSFRKHEPVRPDRIFNSLKPTETEEPTNVDLSDTAYSYAPSKPFLADDVAEEAREKVPGPPQHLKAPLVKSRFVALSWKAPVENSEDIITYTVYYRQEGSGRERSQNTSRAPLEEINISNLQPSRVYHFRVVAYNTYGPGPSSESLTVTTQSEEHVPSAPLEFDAYAVGPNTIRVTWDEPEIPNGEITHYKVYYMDLKTSVEHSVDTNELDAEITSLAVYTEYSVWVVAFNGNGAGAATEEKIVRTLGAPPSEPPYNVTVEPSSTSIVVRWEPPPESGQNGVITGYKLRYREKSKQGNTVMIAGSERMHTLENLDRGAIYQVKMWAININGTGPSTDWIEAVTYENDLIETKVPDSPTPMRVRAQSDRIFVMWGPPENQDVRVRSYILEWGKIVPDMYSKILDEQQRNYVIENLDANTDYVISLRAANDMGPGPPVYATAKTQDEPPPEPQKPLLPPVGLKAQVLSPSSVILYWTDSTLSKNQRVADKRYYVVRYTAEKSMRSRYINWTELNIMIDDLKPNTLYEFSVKLVKGRKESPWSMIVQNRTWELALNAEPKNLDVHPKPGSPQDVELTWDPPKIQNGRITGYIILYTDNSSKNTAEWSAQAFSGDKNSFVFSNLRPLTTYYFKIQARNSRGYGPFSSVVKYTTSENVGMAASGSRQQLDGHSIFSGAVLLYLIIGACVTALTTIAVVIGVLCCRRRESNNQSPDRNKKGYQKGNQNIKPPDLWIHHDQMELKALEKNHSNNDGASSSGAMTLPRSVAASDYEPQESHHSNSLDKRSYVPNYMGVTSDDKNKRMKAKPITLPVDAKPPREPVATATPINITPNQTNIETTPSSRAYPRTQYTISRAHVTIDQNALVNPQPVENPYVSHPVHAGYESSTYVSAQSSPHIPPGSTYAPGMNVLAESQAAKRLQGQGHPLKSFTVPAPPPISAPGTPQPKHAQPQVTIRPTSSPFKKASMGSSSTLTGTPPSRISAANPPPHTAEEVQKLQPSHSTEELNQEMANLEGLMLTLNAITANEFEC